MAGLDLGSLVGQALDHADASDDASNQISTITNTIAGVNEDQATSDRAAGDAAATIEEARQTAIQQQEASRQQIAARLGMDSTGAGWVIGQQADAILDANTRLKAASDKIAQKQSIGFFDNPAGWLAAHFTVNSDIAEYNAAARDKNNAEDTAANMAKLTSDAFINQNALVSTVTQSTIQAGKIVVAQKYNDAASQAAAAGLRANLEGVTLAMNMDRDKISTLFQANGAIMQDKQYKVELQRLQLANQEFDLRKQAFAEKSDEDSLVLKYIQKGYFNLSGGQQMEPARAKDAMVLYRAKEPNTVAMFNSGLASYQVSPDGSKPVIALNPYDTASLFESGRVQGLPQIQNGVGTKLVEWKREFSSPQVQATLGIDRKDKAGMSAAFTAFVARQQAQEVSNTPQGSIFAPADLITTAKNPNIANLPVWKNVLGPAAATGVDINDPNIAFGTVLAAVAQGKLSYPDAVDTSILYSAGLNLNNQARNFIAMGLPPVRSYNTKVNMPGSMGKSTINLVDQRSIATALNRAEAARMNFQHNEMIMQSDAGTSKQYSVGMPDLPDMPSAPKFGSQITYPGNEEERLRQIRLGGNK